MSVAAVGGFVRQAADDHDLLLERFERREDGGKLVGFSRAGGCPLVRTHAIGHEEAGHADRITGRSGLPVKRAHRFQKRKRHGGAEAFERLAS